MHFSRQLALGIATGATLVSAGFIAVSYSVDQSYMTLFFRYFWMVLYFIFAMAVMICVDAAFQLATGGWWPPSWVGRYSKVVGKWTLITLVLWLAFSESVFFLWIVFVLALAVLFWIRFRNHSVSAVLYRISWLGVAAIITGVFLAVAKALVWSKGMVDAGVKGYAAAGILIPLLIAYAIAGRKAKRNWDKFGFWFAGLTLFFLLLEVTGDLAAK